MGVKLSEQNTLLNESIFYRHAFFYFLLSLMLDQATTYHEDRILQLFPCDLNIFFFISFICIFFFLQIFILLGTEKYLGDMKSF